MEPLISVEDAIALLNDMFRADPKATAELFDFRVPCNNVLADHSTIQISDTPSVRHTPVPAIAANWVGLIGVINGIFGTNDAGSGHIALAYDDNDNLVGFRRTLPPLDVKTEESV